MITYKLWDVWLLECILIVVDCHNLHYLHIWMLIQHCSLVFLKISNRKHNIIFVSVVGSGGPTPQEKNTRGVVNCPPTSVGHEWARQAPSSGPYARSGWIGPGPLAAVREGLFPSRRRLPPGKKSLPCGRPPGLLHRTSVAYAKPKGRRSFP